MLKCNNPLEPCTGTAMTPPSMACWMETLPTMVSMKGMASLTCTSSGKSPAHQDSTQVILWGGWGLWAPDLPPWLWRDVWPHLMRSNLTSKVCGGGWKFGPVLFPCHLGCTTHLPSGTSC